MKNAEFSGMLVGVGWGGVRVRMEDEECENDLEIVIAVAKFHAVPIPKFLLAVALILLLVDPIDEVLVAIH